MLGFLPNKMNFSLETFTNGETKMTFKEWHSYASDEEFQKVSEGTNKTAKLLLEQFSALKLEVDFKTLPNEKAFEITFTGKDVKPAIFAIISELLPRLIKSEKDALKVLNNILQIILLSVKFEMIEGGKAFAGEKEGIEKRKEELHLERQQYREGSAYEIYLGGVIQGLHYALSYPNGTIAWRTNIEEKSRIEDKKDEKGVA